MGTVPSWFREALATTPGHLAVESGGVTLHYRAWGARGRPVLLLVHGGLANAAWWDHVAPLLQGYRVLAVDVSGHGRSGWREDYGYDIWAADLAAVLRVERSDRRAIVAGHSSGGWMAMRAAATYPELIRGIVVIDSATGVDRPDLSGIQLDERGAPRRRVHASRQDMVDRFRTLPEERGNLDFVLRHVAENSICRVDGGWSWQFDPLVGVSPPPMGVADISPVTCPVTLVRGEHGLASKEAHDLTRRRLGVPAFEHLMLGCGHHIMLHRPIELAEVIQCHVDAHCAELDRR